MKIRTDLYLGDSKKQLAKLDDNSVDLIVTSPPYADQRKDTYGGIHHAKYVEWDSWERLLQFNKNKHFNMYQEEVMVPMGDWAKTRLKKLSDTDKIRDTSKVGSGFGKNISNWIDRDKAYPTNVLHLATECNNKNHSAAFPEELPEWFIKLFTKQHDTVLDPFMGSGTTLIVANRMKRNSVGIDIMPEYYDMVKQQLKPVELYLLEPKVKYGKAKPERHIAVR